MKEDKKTLVTSITTNPFAHIDRLIELQSQKLEALKEHRKGLVQHLIKNKIE